MALTVSNMRVGAMRAYWDTPGTELELGLTLEGSQLTIEQAGAEVASEQYGIAPIDYIYGGEKVTATLKFLESYSQTANDVLKVLLQGSTDSSGATTKALQFGSVPGAKASSIAKQLRLHPAKTANQATDTEDIILYLAAPIFTSDPIELSNSSPRVFTVTFLALVDTSKSDGNLLGSFKVNAA